MVEARQHPEPRLKSPSVASSERFWRHTLAEVCVSVCVCVGCQLGSDLTTRSFVRHHSSELRFRDDAAISPSDCAPCLGSIQVTIIGIYSNNMISLSW